MQKHSAHHQAGSDVGQLDRYQQIAEGMPNIVWTADAKGHASYYNRRWFEYTGLSEGESLGEGWARVLHADDLARTAELWHEAVTTGKAFDCEHRLQRYDGTYRWHLTRAFPLVDDGGRVVKWFGTAMDVHDAKTSTEQLRVAKEQAEAASRAKDEFLAALSHELRTPLTPVLMMAQSLEANEQLPPDVRADVQAIRRQVELEARLIDDLLDVTRITHGKMQIRQEPLNVHELIAHALDTCCSQAKKGDKIRFIDHYDAAEAMVMGDAARLQQVFWNILSNSVKFTPEGIITIVTRNEGENIVVTISDDGVGIAPELLPRIFNAFEQGGQQTTRRFGGLGLGLAITRSLVEAHGGTIKAESKGVGYGAKFTVTLPLAMKHVMSKGLPRTAPVVDETRPQYRILLVEDHDATARVLSRLLQTTGHMVVHAATVSDAMKAADNSKFDLVISDVGLPDGTGHELIEYLHKRHSLVGIALSGYGMDEDLARSKAAGFVEHLTKPVSFERLQEAIARVGAHRVQARN